MLSVTAILLVLKLPSFDTVVHNYKYSFYRHWTGSVNSVVQYLSRPIMPMFIVFFLIS